MSAKSFSLKIILLFLIYLKIECHEENLTKKNTTIYLNYTSYFINSTIRTISDKNFDTIISSVNSNNFDYLFLFTLKRCPNCNNVIKITENVEKYYKEKNLKIKFYKLDYYLNQWTAMRFNAFKIPIYIYIKQGFYSSFNMENLTEDDLINFIEDENKEFIEIPGKINYFDVCRKIVHNITIKVQKKIWFWNDFFTVIFILSVFFGFLYFEFVIYRAGCCGHKNRNDQNVHLNKNNRNKKKEKNENEIDKVNKDKYKED
jgi:hypothetical protein